MPVLFGASDDIPAPTEQLLIFLRRVRDIAPEREARAAKFGDLYILTPGGGSVMDIRGDTVVSRGTGFIGLREDAPGAIHDPSGVVYSTPFQKSFPLSDGVEAITSQRDAPVAEYPTAQAVSPEAAAWLQRFDAACAFVAPQAGALKQALFAASDRGTLSSDDLAGALHQFDEVRDTVTGLVADDAPDGDLKARVDASTAILNDARTALVIADGKQGTDLRVQLGSFADLISRYQLTWLGLDVNACKSFL